LAVKIAAWLIGIPHEALHALALILIGRRPHAITRTSIDIPADLSQRQFVFVAGFPAGVFFALLAIALVGMITAHTLAQTALAMLIALYSAAALAGTMGDLHLIAQRLAQPS
jgi:hypothetical protein